MGLINIASMKDIAKAIKGPAWVVAGICVLVGLALAYKLLFR